MYKSKRRPDENEAGNVALIPSYSDFKSCHGVRSLRNHLRYRNFRPDFPEMNIHNTPWWKKESCTKTHCQTLNMWIISLMRPLVCALWQVFVGWVKPYTAYPTKAAFWKAAVFPGLTMKNHVFIGRDTIEKDVGNASLIPTYADFKSRHGVRSPRSNLRYRNFRPDFPEMSIHNTPGWKTGSWTKTHCQTLNMWIISLMRLLGMCPMTNFRRLG